MQSLFFSLLCFSAILEFSYQQTYGGPQICSEDDLCKQLEVVINAKISGQMFPPTELSECIRVIWKTIIAQTVDSKGNGNVKESIILILELVSSKS